MSKVEYLTAVPYRYQAAWDKLPTAIQEDEGKHPKGFKSFEDWYESMNFGDELNDVTSFDR